MYTQMDLVIAVQKAQEEAYAQGKSDGWIEGYRQAYKDKR